MNTKKLYTVLICCIGLLCGDAHLFAGKKPKQVITQKKKRDDDAFLDAYLKQQQEKVSKQFIHAQKTLQALQENKLYLLFNQNLNPQTSLQEPKNAINHINSFTAWLKEFDYIIHTHVHELHKLCEQYIILLEMYEEAWEVQTHFDDALLKICNFEDQEQYWKKLCLNIIETSSYELTEEERELILLCSDKDPEDNYNFASQIKQKLAFIQKSSNNSTSEKFRIFTQLLLAKLDLHKCSSIANNNTDAIKGMLSLINILEKKNSIVPQSIRDTAEGLAEIFQDIIDEERGATEQTCELPELGKALAELDEQKNELGPLAQQTLSYIHQQLTLINDESLNPSLPKQKKQPKPTVPKNNNALKVIDEWTEETSTLVSNTALEYEINPITPPYKRASAYIMHWLSGKNYWDTSLKQLRDRYAYDESYMKIHHNEIIQSHTFPIELDGFVIPLASKQPWFDKSNKQTGWLYTIPGYLEDHTTKRKERGSFTWGITFDDMCLHRSFSLRKDKNIFTIMTKSEVGKNEELKNELLFMDKNTTPNDTVIVKQNALYVIAHTKENNTTSYLSKCLYNKYTDFVKTKI